MMAFINNNLTTILIVVIWFIGAIIAWFCLKHWQGEDYKPTVGHVLENMCMSAASWLIWILWLIWYIHNKVVSK